MVNDDQNSGQFGRGGNRPVCITFKFYGRLGASFIDYAIARAERLDLKGWIKQADTHVITHVEGPDALVGAFEMACCLGPVNAEIIDWTCRHASPCAHLSGYENRCSA